MTTEEIMERLRRVERLETVRKELKRYARTMMRPNGDIFLVEVGGDGHGTLRQWDHWTGMLHTLADGTRVTLYRELDRLARRYALFEPTPVKALIAGYPTGLEACHG